MGPAYWRSDDIEIEGQAFEAGHGATTSFLEGGGDVMPPYHGYRNAGWQSG